MLKVTNEFDRLITHSTKFHADDVFSTALMQIINPKAYVIRTLNPECVVEDINELTPELTYIVYDIGRGEYDHHQEDAEVRGNGIKYAAFGLLWREFGDHNQYPDFDKDFVQKIDDHDNGGKTFDISIMIGSFNPTAEEESSKSYIGSDIAFKKAVEIAREYLIRIFANYDDENKANEYIKNNGLYFDEDNILIIPKYCKYSKYVHSQYPNCKVIIYPHKRGGYACQVNTISHNTMESKYTFNKEWCGINTENLPYNVTFVHNSGFLLTTKDINTALYHAKNSIYEK